MTAYALVKYRQTFLTAIEDAYSTYSPSNVLGIHIESIKEALNVRQWGTDYHLFALSHLLNRPIINYISQPSFTHTFLGVSTVEQFADCFLSNEFDTQHHCIWCTNAHEALLSDINQHETLLSDINQLPHLPISVFNMNNYHWIAMLPWSQSSMQHIPIPRSRLLKE